MARPRGCTTCDDVLAASSADVRLYDRLLVPVPDGDDETSWWTRLHRRPDLPKRLEAAATFHEARKWFA